MAEPTKDYEALTNLSVHRDRQAGEAPGMTGADLVYRGDKVSLNEERAQRLLKLGAIRPWSERNRERKTVTARDMSGKQFPDQRGAKAGTTEPEANDPNPEDSEPKDSEGKDDVNKK